MRNGESEIERVEEWECIDSRGVREIAQSHKMEAQTKHRRCSIILIEQDPP